MLIKFGVDIPYEKIMLFKTAVESFVKARPREWLSLSAFRATRVEYDAAFVEYVIGLQHVEVRHVNGKDCCHDYMVMLTFSFC